MKLNLQYFAGGHSVTCYRDAHASAFSASSNSDVQANATVTLTVTPASGYTVDEIEVVQGGVEVKFEDNAWTFKMGSADVVLYLKTKSTTTFKVVENCFTAVNGTVTELKRDMILKYGPNGAIIGVDSNGTSLSSLSADILANLKAAGVIIPI